MSNTKIYFPSGKSLENCKKAAKKLRREKNISLSQAQNIIAKENGLDMPWSEAMKYLKDYQSSFFANTGFQEDAHWQIDVNIGGFATFAEAKEFANQIELVWDQDKNKPFVVHFDKVIEIYEHQVELRVLREDARSKMMTSLDDMELVKASFSEWPELFGNNKPYFESLSWGVVKDGVFQPAIPRLDPKKEDDIANFTKLERIGLQVRNEQAGLNLYQITHPYVYGERYYYVQTPFTKDEILAVMAAIMQLQEEDNYFPNYFGGCASVEPAFVCLVLKEIFNQTIISTEHYDYNQSEDKHTDCEALNMFHVEDAFLIDDYKGGREAHGVIKSHDKESLYKMFRRALGLPQDLDDTQWMIKNTNEQAVDLSEHGFPLNAGPFDIKEVWSKYFKLNDAVIDFYSQEEALEPHEENYYSSYRDGHHTYPMYRVTHKTGAKFKGIPVGL